MYKINKDLQKSTEISEFRKLTARYSLNMWFGVGIIASHITARMVKENPDNEAKYRTLDFILRIDEVYIDKKNNEKLDTQFVKIVISSPTIMDLIVKKKFIRGDVVSIQGKLITKELSKETGYNRTQYVIVNNAVDHNVYRLLKSKLDQEFKIFTLEEDREVEE